MAFGEHFSVAEDVQGEWRQGSRFALSLRMMGNHRGFQYRRGLVGCALLKDETLAGWGRMAGRQEGRPEGIKVLQVSGDGGPNSGGTQWGGLRGCMRYLGTQGSE